MRSTNVPIIEKIIADKMIPKGFNVTIPSPLSGILILMNFQDINSLIKIEEKILKRKIKPRNLEIIPPYG